MTQQLTKTAEEAIMEQFKAKKQNIVIVYPDDEIIFQDIKGYSLNGPYLVVQLHDDTQYVYPMSAVCSLKLYVTE